jgi:Domain of unknown function (DUF6916)
MDNHSAEHFSQHVNTKFRVNVDSPEPVELELVEVNIRPSEPNEQAGMERFSTFFYGPSNVFLPQHTYEVVHPGMGEFQIFLVAIGKDERGFKYEAVFNRFNSD